MHVAIVGKGRLGNAVKRQLDAAGAATVLLSKSTGFDVTGPVSFDGLGTLDAVVEATDILTMKEKMKKKTATAFFTASTKNIGAAVRAAGITRHILVSIVNVSDPDLAANGYYAGKAAQEREILRNPGGVTIIRSTFWYEFAQQSLDRMTLGPLELVPRMVSRPVALDAVAEVVAAAALGQKSVHEHNLCGPEVLGLVEMTKLLSKRPTVTLPLYVPGKAGKAFRGGALVPAEGTAEVIGPTYEQWLHMHQNIPPP
jgi:uncharacterized protein YbjT (DUF2867 family)